MTIKKLNRLKSIGAFLLVSALLFQGCSPYNKGRYLAQDGEAAKTAYQVYGELLEGSLSYEAKVKLLKV